METTLKDKNPPTDESSHCETCSVWYNWKTSASTFLEHKSALNGWRQTLSMQIYYFQQNSKFPNASAVSGSNNMFMSPCWPVVLIEQLVLLDSERLAVESKSPPALIKARCNSGLHKVRMNWACNASLTITGIVQLVGYITEAVSGRQRAKSQGELLQEAVFTGWRAYYWRPGRYWVLKNESVQMILSLIFFSALLPASE